MTGDQKGTVDNSKARSIVAVVEANQRLEDELNKRRNKDKVP